METPDFLPHLTGSFAMPAAENPTVAMVEAAYKYHGLHYRYINCEVNPRDLADAVKGAKAMGWVGFNCSIPHKVAVIPHLDGLGVSASLIGAVNTVVRRDGQWIGENTDGRGFLRALQQVTDPSGKKVVLFGAGGAARAVAVELALDGVAEITIVNRNPVRAGDLVDLLNSKTLTKAKYVSWTKPYHIPADTDIVINATSVGLYPNVNEKLNIDFDSLRIGMVVADGIHNPLVTHLLKEATNRNCIVVNGLQMLVYQGVIGIKYWTGVDTDVEVMFKELMNVLDTN